MLLEREISWESWSKINSDVFYQKSKFVKMLIVFIVCPFGVYCAQIREREREREFMGESVQN